MPKPRAEADPESKTSDGGMKVTLAGSPESVREQAQVLAGTNGNGDAKPVEPDNGIVNALRDPRNAVVVKRISPRRWKNANGEDAQINSEVYREACPLILSEIADEVARTHGGRKYRVSVINPKGEVAAAQTFDVDADPILEEASAADSELARQVMGLNEPEEKSAAEVSLESLDREARLAAKQFELEQAKQRLRDLKGESAPGRKTDDEAAQRIAKLEREVVETRYETKAAALEKEVSELRRQLAEPRREDSSSKDMMKMFMDMQAKSDERFQQLIQQMQNSKMDQLVAEVKALKTAPAQQGSDLSSKILEKAVDKFLDGDDEEGEDDGDDPNKPWFERLADKYMPDIIDLIKDRGQQGKPMTKEEITQQIEAAAKKAEDEAVEAAQRRLAQQAPAARLPGPAAPAAPPAAPPPSAPAAPAAPPKQLTLEEEFAQRCGHVLTLFSRELTLRTREWEWSYEAWGQLPEAVLDKVTAAADPVVMVDAFAGIFPPEALEALKKRFDDPKARAWAERGLRQLREWSAKLAADPEFDPLDEDEEEKP